MAGDQQNGVSPDERRPIARVATFGALILLSLGACQREAEDDSGPEFTVETSTPLRSIPFQVAPEALYGRRGSEFGSPPEGLAQRYYYVPLGKAEFYKKIIEVFMPPEDLTLELVPSFLSGEFKSYSKTDPEITQVGLDLLLVRAPEETLIMIEEFIASLETDVPQVSVEAKVVEIVVSDELQLGVTTIFANDNTKTLFDTGAARFNTRSFLESLGPGNVGGFQGGVINLGTIQDETVVDIIIEALARRQNTEIIATPNLVVLSGHKATMNSGQETPIQTTTIVNNTTTVKTEYKQTGVLLDIVPTVIGDGTEIQLRVRPEVSVVTGFTDAATFGGFPSPIISTRNAETVVNLKSGETLVIGGLVSTTEVERIQRVPILGSIPFVKHLFRSKETDQTRTQLLFFITVKIASTGVYYPEGPGF